MPCSIKRHPFTKSSLVIKKSRDNDTGNYFCEARNVIGVVRYPIKLLIQGKLDPFVTDTFVVMISNFVSFLVFPSLRTIHHIPTKHYVSLAFQYHIYPSYTSSPPKPSFPTKSSAGAQLGIFAGLVVVIPNDIY